MIRRTYSTCLCPVYSLNLAQEVEMISCIFMVLSGEIAQRAVVFSCDLVRLYGRTQVLCETARPKFSLYEGIGRTRPGDDGTYAFFFGLIYLKPVLIYVIERSLAILKVHIKSGSLRGVQDHRAWDGQLRFGR